MHILLSYVYMYSYVSNFMPEEVGATNLHLQLLSWPIGATKTGAETVV